MPDSPRILFGRFCRSSFGRGHGQAADGRFPAVRTSSVPLKFLAIAGNHISIPIKAVFRYPAQVFFTGLVTVNVYKAIALLITIQPAQNISKRPRAVTQQLHAIADRLLAGLEVALQVGNAVGVVNGVIGVQRVELTQTVSVIIIGSA